MVKKIMCVCIVLCMTFSLMVTAQAETKSSISSDTIITENNISEVLEYLGIDSSNFIKNEVSEKSVQTVGELEQAILEAKQMLSTVNINNNAKINTNNIFDINSAVEIKSSGSGSIVLSSSTKVDSYTLYFDVTGQYKDGKWTNATSASVSVDSNFLLYTFKIDSKKLTLSHTPDKITLKSEVTVFVYVGVGDLGLVKISEQTTKGTHNWYKSEIPK